MWWESNFQFYPRSSKSHDTLGILSREVSEKYVAQEICLLVISNTDITKLLAHKLVLNWISKVHNRR